MTEVWKLLSTEVASGAPLKTTSDEATKWVPVAVRTKLGGSCEKTMLAGEIELRNGAGRELPHRGFRALHPGKIESTNTNKLRLPNLQE